MVVTIRRWVCEKRQQLLQFPPVGTQTLLPLFCTPVQHFLVSYNLLGATNTQKRGRCQVMGCVPLCYALAEGCSRAVSSFNIANLFTQPLLSLLTRSWQKHERCKEGEVFFLSYSLYPLFLPMVFFFCAWVSENIWGWPVRKELKTLNKFVFTLMMRAKFERRVNMFSTALWKSWENLYSGKTCISCWEIVKLVDCDGFSLSLITRSRFVSDFSVCIVIHWRKIIVWLGSNENLADCTTYKGISYYGKRGSSVG